MDDFGKLFVRQAGEGRAPVLALHGLSASSAFWLPLVEELKQDFSFVLPDLLGFGSSPKPKLEYTVHVHLEALRPVVESIDGPFDVWGHSMGTSLAIQAAARWPDRIRRVVLFNAPINSTRLKRDERYGEMSWRSRLFGAFFYGLAPLITRIGYRLRPHIPREVVRDYFRHNGYSYTTSLRHLVFERRLLEDMAELRQPVLAIQGGNDGVVGDSSGLAWPPNVTLQIVLDGDHIWPLLRPVEAAGLVRETLGHTVAAGGAVAT